MLHFYSLHIQASQHDRSFEGEGAKNARRERRANWSVQNADWLQTIFFRFRKQWDYCCLVPIICSMLKTMVCGSIQSAFCTDRKGKWFVMKDAAILPYRDSLSRVIQPFILHRWCVFITVKCNIYQCQKERATRPCCLKLG